MMTTYLISANIRGTTSLHPRYITSYLYTIPWQVGLLFDRFHRHQMEPTTHCVNKTGSSMKWKVKIGNPLKLRSLFWLGWQTIITNLRHEHLQARLLYSNFCQGIVLKVRYKNTLTRGDGGTSKYLLHLCIFYTYLSSRTPRSQFCPCLKIFRKCDLTFPIYSMINWYLIDVMKKY